MRMDQSQRDQLIMEGNQQPVMSSYGEEDDYDEENEGSEEDAKS
jgi:hypothetical protein